MSKKLTSVFKIDGNEVEYLNIVVGSLKVYVNKHESQFNPSITLYFVDPIKNNVQAEFIVVSEGGPEGSCSQELAFLTTKENERR
jgi:hypothetical protein